MDILNVLVGEHGIFYGQFEYLEQVLSSVSEIEEVQVPAGLLAAAVEAHSALEDDLLFAALEPHLDADSPDVLGMRMMHEEIAAGFERVRVARDVHGAREACVGVIELARQHFVGEETFVFPKARLLLTEDARDTLGAAWADRRGVMRAFGMWR
jgi:hemerythrin-like domain-containing protein